MRADSQVEVPGPSALAQRFGDVLRVGDGRSAEGVINDALAMGMAPEAIHALVMVPAMVRLGELWECQAITVADEHLATSICQRVLVRLVEALSARRIPQGSLPRVLLAGVEGQHHTLGLA